MRKHGTPDRDFISLIAGKTEKAETGTNLTITHLLLSHHSKNYTPVYNAICLTINFIQT